MKIIGLNEYRRWFRSNSNQNHSCRGEASIIAIKTRSEQPATL